MPGSLLNKKSSPNSATCARVGFVVFGVLVHKSTRPPNTVMVVFGEIRY